MTATKIRLASCIAAVSAVLLAAAGCHETGAPEPPPLKIRRAVPPPARLAEQPVSRPAPLPATKPKEVELLDKRVSCIFSGASLTDACATLSTLKKVTIAPSPEILKYCRAHKLTLNLHFLDMPLRGVLDWMARQIDGSYVVVPGFGVCITKDYEWLAGAPIVQKAYTLHTSVRFKKPIDGLYDLSTERDAVIDLAGRFLRVAERHCRGSGLRTGLRDDVLLVSAPERGHEIMEQLLAEVDRGEQRDAPPLPSARDAQLDELEKLLKTTVNCRFSVRPILDAVAELTGAGGVNIGFDPRSLRFGTKTTVTFDIGAATLKFALEKLAASAGLGHVILEPGRGVWINGRKRTDRWSESGQLFWYRAVVRSYYVGHLTKSMHPDKLIELIRLNVTSDEWGEFGPGLGFHPAGRMIVFHDEYGQRRVAEYLAEAAAMIEGRRQP